MDTQIRSAVWKILNAGLQLTPDALSFLKEYENCYEIAEKIIEKVNAMKEKPLCITKEFLEKIVGEKKRIKENENSFSLQITGSKRFKPLAAEIQEDIEVEFDPTEKIKSQGNVEDFLSYFRDRFNKLRKLFIKRRDLKNIVTSKTVFNRGKKENISLIGLVSSKNETKSGNILIELEDLEGKVNVIIPSRKPELIKKASKVLLDQVICIEGTINNGFIIADNILWPDVSTQHMPHRAKEHIRAALISDTHAGSKQFLEDCFMKFIRWLQGKVGNGKQREIAGQVKYVIIAGDLVDGIGVYPNQEEELKIKDVYEQYEMLSKYLEMIPEYIKIIAIPGNHDATRQAVPQPAIPENYARPLYDLSNVIMLGNPTKIKLHGVRFLVSHGRSIDDLISDVPNLPKNNPAEAMKLLLKSRHLAPQFGKTPIAPETTDWMIIDEPPDVFHAGHVHVNGQANYRNVTIINSGTWQDQTSFQKSIGLIPTPGKVPIYDFNSGDILLLNFKTE